MNHARPLALLLGLAFAASAALAQDPNTTIIDRAQQPSPPPPAPARSDVGQVLGTEGEDTGVQRIAEPRKLPFKLNLSTDTQVYFTNNVLLQPEDNPQSDSDAVVFANTVSLRIEGKSLAVFDGLLTPSVALVYQRYYHGISSDDPARDDLDFDSYSIPFTLRYRTQNGWEASLGVTAGSIYSLNAATSYDNIYRNLTPSLGVRKLVGLDRDNLLSFGGTVSYSATWADTPGGIFDYRDDRNDKIDVALDAAYYHFRGRWTYNLYGRVALTDYQHYQEAGLFTGRDVDRRDTTYAMGAGVSYALAPWAAARAFTSLDWRDSNRDGDLLGDDYTYEAANLGLGVSLNFAF
jgi:hypothetical protein